MIYIILISLMIWWACPAATETFRWVDEQGRVYFTDDFTKIPEKYQPGAVRIATEDQVRTKPGNEGQDKRGESEVKDRSGRGEGYWRERVAEAKGKIKSIEERDRNLRQKYNELTTRLNDSRNSVERATIRNEREQVRQEMERNRADLEEAKNVLEKKIPEEAELYKAKPEWIK